MTPPDAPGVASARSPLSACSSGDARTDAPGRSAPELSAKARRRGAILDAAETLFIERGYDRTGLADVVRRSGGSLATLYDMFASKQGLLHAIAIRWRDETTADRARRESSGGESPREVLLGYVRSECEIWRTPRAAALVRMLVSECLRDRTFAADIYRDLHLPFIAGLASLFVAWSQEGAARIDDPEATARLFAATISGDMILSRLSGLEEAVPDEDEVIWRLRPIISYFGIGGAISLTVFPA